MGLTQPIDIETTYGSYLLGTLFSTLFTGITFAQVIVYFTVYKDDPKWLKILVVFVSIIDVTCTSFMWAGLWELFITHYADRNWADTIPWGIALIMLFSSFLTCSVHSFFAHRIYLLSKRKFFTVVPIIGFELLRLAIAIVITTKFFQLNSLSAFQTKYSWIFTFGLCALVATEVLVTGCLITYLRRSRTDVLHSPINHTLNNLIHSAIETGLVTCIGTIVALICWIAMPSNLVFLGIFFTVSQLYAITFLLNLNSRHVIRRGHSASLLGTNNMPLPIKFRSRQTYPPPLTPSISGEHSVTSRIKVDVERYVAVDRLSHSMSLPASPCNSPAPARDVSQDARETSLMTNSPVSRVDNSQA